MKRRKLLATLGAAAGLSGCTGRATDADPGAGGTTSKPPGTDQTTEPTTNETTVTDDLKSMHPIGTVVELPSGQRVGAKSASVSLAIVYSRGYKPNLFSRENTQYLDVAVVRPGREAYTDGWKRMELRIDGDSYPEMMVGSTGMNPVSAMQPDRALFPVGTDLDPDSGTIVWPGTDDVPEQRFELDDAHLRALRLQPSYSLVEFSVEGASRSGDRVAADVTVTVANDGERDGEFVGLLHLPTTGHGRDYFPAEPVEMTVPRGDERTWSRTVRWREPPEDGGSVSFQWNGGSRSEELTF